jgi:uncharacterized membrane protein YphA (DoxX/SURF4 family)
MIRLPNLVSRAGHILLVVAFVAAGLSKLAGASAIRWGDRFEQWGYPANAHYVVGVLEVLGGLGVLLPRWRRHALLALAALMVGALLTHLAAAEYSRAVPPFVLGVLALVMRRAYR